MFTSSWFTSSLEEDMRNNWTGWDFIIQPEIESSSAVSWVDLPSDLWSPGQHDSNSDSVWDIGCTVCPCIHESCHVETPTWSLYGEEVLYFTWTSRGEGDVFRASTNSTTPPQSVNQSFIEPGVVCLERVRCYVWREWGGVFGESEVVCLEGVRWCV